MKDDKRDKRERGVITMGKREDETDKYVKKGEESGGKEGKNV